MRRENWVKMLPILQAWIDGKTIEVKEGDTWKDFATPTTTGLTLAFECNPESFRIKPEPKLRPWKPEEVPVGAVIRHKQLRKMEVIVSALDGGLCIWQHHSITFEVALKCFEWALLYRDHTWKPCGVEETAS